MRVSDFDFELPPERIALRPANPRESAKLLVVGDEFVDSTVGDLPSQLRAGDVLVFNNTKVIPAALTGVRLGRGEGAVDNELAVDHPLAAHGRLDLKQTGKDMASAGHR